MPTPASGQLSVRAQAFYRAHPEELPRIVQASSGLQAVAQLFGVEAAAALQEPQAPDVVRDAIGNPVEPLAQPVRISHGRPQAQWSHQEVSDAFLWQLGPRFRGGLKPPPAGDGYFIPSPNAHSYYDQASGQWVAKNPYKVV